MTALPSDGLLRFFGWLFVAVVVATALALGMGSRLPAEVTTEASREIGAPRGQVWSLLTDAPGQMRWRSDLQNVEMLRGSDGQTCWRELAGGVSLPFCDVEKDPPRRRVVRTADPRLPDREEWTYELTEVSPVRTSVRVTRRCDTAPAMRRFWQRYFGREDTRVRTYLDDLARAAASR